LGLNIAPSAGGLGATGLGLTLAKIGNGKAGPGHHSIGLDRNATRPG
jgi:hypothetical protein